MARAPRDAARQAGPGAPVARAGEGSSLREPSRVLRSRRAPNVGDARRDLPAPGVACEPAAGAQLARCQFRIGYLVSEEVDPDGRTVSTDDLRANLTRMATVRRGELDTPIVAGPRDEGNHRSAGTRWTAGATARLSEDIGRSRGGRHAYVMLFGSGAITVGDRRGPVYVVVLVVGHRHVQYVFNAVIWKEEFMRNGQRRTQRGLRTAPPRTPVVP